MYFNVELYECISMQKTSPECAKISQNHSVHVFIEIQAIDCTKYIVCRPETALSTIRLVLML